MPPHMSHYNNHHHQGSKCNSAESIGAAQQDMNMIPLVLGHHSQS